MSESIVKVPLIKEMDYDYIAFSFKGKHSYEDFGIYRVSDANTGYNENLSSTMKDQVVDVAGQDGQYYLGTELKTKEFNIKFAFDCLNEGGLAKLRAWLSGKDVGDLWFAEAPYKVYSAKVSGVPTVNATAFLQEGKRVYKGTGSVKFISYYPYGHTPRWIQFGEALSDGKNYQNYGHFNNYSELHKFLPGYTGTDEPNALPYGQLPFTYVANLARVGKRKIIIYANNGTSEKKVYEVTDNTSQQIKRSDFDSIFTRPSADMIIQGFLLKDGTDFKNFPSAAANAIVNIDGGEADIELYAKWNTTYTVTFYKTLSSYTKDTYIGAVLKENYTQHTGKQELYGCNISTDGTTYEIVPVEKYRGNFSATGTLGSNSTLTVFPGTKIQVWVQDDPSFKGTSCHILENNVLKKSEKDPTYIYTVTGNTKIIFDWRTSGLGWFGNSNWNCYINTTYNTNISNGVYGGGT